MMTLKKWMKKIVDPLVLVSIWTQDDDTDPAYEGYLLDVPWYFVDMPIGRADKDSDEPIYISTMRNPKTGNIEPVIIINLISN